MPRKSKVWTIYALKDPRTGKPHFVGHSYQMQDAINRHEATLRMALTPRDRWLMELGAAGFMFEVEVLEKGEGDWSSASKLWIVKLREQGHPLTNMGDGGRGASGVPSSDHKRELLRTKLTGRQYSEETLEKLRKAARNRPPGFYEELAARNRANAKPMSPEQRAAMSRVHKGIPLTAEHRAKISAGLKRFQQNKKGGTDAA